MKFISLKKKKKLNYFEAFGMTLFLIAVIVWFSLGFNDVGKANKAQQLSETRASVLKSVVLCYSVEGQFPPDIDYLKKNYGLFLNDDKYIVSYEVFAPNIMPDISVFERPVKK